MRVLTILFLTTLVPVLVDCFQSFGTKCNNVVPSLLHPSSYTSTQHVQPLYMSDMGDMPSDQAILEEDEVDNEVASSADRSDLKRRLLQMGASYDRGFGASPSARKRADDLIEQLETLNPETYAAIGISGDDKEDETSPLTGAWRMIWTTASDVLVLGASPVATVGAIYQIFHPPVVTNVIDFIPRFQALLPPSLVPPTLVRAKVKTRASPRPDYPNRIGLLFESVKLQPVEVLGQDTSSLPPFSANLPKIPGTDSDSGPGYFDTTYLDDEMLIIRQNAPGGLFVLVKVDDSEP